LLAFHLNNTFHRKPGGRRTAMCAVFRHGRDAVSKNLVAVADREFALSRKALSFDSFLFGQKKK